MPDRVDDLGGALKGEPPRAYRVARSKLPSPFPDRPRATDGSADSEQAAAQQAQQNQHGHAWAWRPRAWSDVLVSTGLVVLAAAVALTLPDESTLRAALTVPVLLVAPGYLILQGIFVPARRARQRLLHAALGLAVSPPLVGLFALSTIVVPGTFSPNAIIAAVTLGCLALASLALFRRERHRAEAPRRAAVDEPAAE